MIPLPLPILPLAQLPDVASPDSYIVTIAKEPLAAALLIALGLLAILHRVLPYLLDRRKGIAGPSIEIAERRAKQIAEWDVLRADVTELKDEVKQLADRMPSKEWITRMEQSRQDQHKSREIFQNHSVRITTLEGNYKDQRETIDETRETCIETNTLVKEMVKRLDRAGA